MRRGWQIASVAALALFGLVIALSLQLSLNDSLGPGPGFFPFWLSTIGVVLAVLLFLEVTSAPPDAADTAAIVPERAAAWRVGRVLVALTGVALLLEPLGLRLSLLIFNAYLLAALGVRRWWVIAVFAVVGSFGVFHVFYYWLKVPLPVGTLGI